MNITIVNLLSLFTTATCLLALMHIHNMRARRGSIALVFGIIAGIGCYGFAVTMRFQQELESYVETTSSATVTLLEQHPGDPTVAQFANRINADLPAGYGDQKRKALDQYVSQMAKSWDDSKELPQQE